MRGAARKTAVALVLLTMMCGNTLFARQVAVIYSDSAKTTLRTIAGLEFTLKEALADLELREYYLTGSGDMQKPVIEASRPDVIVTIGTTSTAFADRAFPNTPVVFAKVLNPIESGFIQSWEQPGRHVTGAALDIPTDLQLKKFMSMIPNLRKVGVVCTEKTRRLVEEARRAAAGMGLEIVSFELSGAKELPIAIDSLCRSVGGIWTVADEELSTPQFIRFALLETLRNRIPVMGFNQSFVQSGALFCLEADYKYIGIQAAEIVRHVLGGANPAQIRATLSEVNYLYLNLKTSKLLNINLPPELIGVAKEIY